MVPSPAGNCNVQSEYLGGSTADLVAGGIRRLPFAYSEHSANPAGLQTGIDILNARGSKDVIDARIWWDTGKNF